ncbi:unnamed protein product [Linum trigynum]|uniref:Uncharacterized protein n=1 Tax=Linum trigynum TaxID=586398 RepID=A0AAV2FE83_9ROSI
MVRDEEDEERSLMGHGKTSAWADRQMVKGSDWFGRAETGWNGPNSFPNRYVSDQGSSRSRQGRLANGARGVGRLLPFLRGSSNGIWDPGQAA